MPLDGGGVSGGGVSGGGVEGGDVAGGMMSLIGQHTSDGLHTDCPPLKLEKNYKYYKYSCRILRDITFDYI